MFQHPFYFAGEHREVGLDNTPDYFIRNGRVTVNQLVPECDDPWRAAHLFGKTRIVPECLVQYFANDLKWRSTPERSSGSFW